MCRIEPHNTVFYRLTKANRHQWRRPLIGELNLGEEMVLPLQVDDVCGVQGVRVHWYQDQNGLRWFGFTVQMIYAFHILCPKDDGRTAVVRWRMTVWPSRLAAILT